MPEHALKNISTSRVLHYVNPDNETISFENYKSKFATLYNKYDDDAGTWASIDDEYAFKKFQATWSPVNELIEESKELTIEIIDLNYNLIDLPPRTQPCRIADPNVNTTNYTLFRYFVEGVDIFQEEASKYGLSYGGVGANSDINLYTLHSVNNLSLMKIGGRYTDYGQLQNLKLNFVGTIEECKTVHENNLKIINDFLKIEVAITNKDKVDPTTAANLYSEIRSLRKKLGEIESKNSTHKALYEAREIANRLSKILRENLKVHILRDENYEALYIDGLKVLEGHSLDAHDVAFAILGKDNAFFCDLEDIDQINYDKDGNSFLDNEMIWKNGEGFVDQLPLNLVQYFSGEN